MRRDIWAKPLEQLTLLLIIHCFPSSTAASSYAPYFDMSLSVAVLYLFRKQVLTSNTSFNPQQKQLGLILRSTRHFSAKEWCLVHLVGKSNFGYCLSLQLPLAPKYLCPFRDALSLLLDSSGESLQRFFTYQVKFSSPLKLLAGLLTSLKIQFAPSMPIPVNSCWLTSHLSPFSNSSKQGIELNVSIKQWRSSLINTYFILPLNHAGPAWRKIMNYLVFAQGTKTRDTGALLSLLFLS